MGVETKYTAFSQMKRVASGTVQDVAVKSKDFLKKEPKASLLVFDDQTGQQVDLNLRGSIDAVSKRYDNAEEKAEKKGPGRPKLGVISKEVTLLPQHWDWLSRQPGGASVTLRKLVEDARKKNAAKDLLRQSQDAAYKVMTALAGDLPNYEEALRALFSKERTKFKMMIQDWPRDVRDYVSYLTANCF